ncbi:unnamed protein product [Rodentolepis nana]|uniref:Protein SYS1 homolog n=1 Tax=Rodentolepis nana TaxID=102285 RepID=A0A0R3THY9_RODNA|nr:unnamed protein product [Rodentolepis nana]
MAQRFRSSEWDPYLLTGQIIFMQCLFYGTLGALCTLVSPISKWHTSLRILLDDSELQFRDGQGRCLIAVFLLSAILCALGLWRLVRRTKLCLDFTCTLYFWHFIFCALYSASFPVSVAWWLTVGLSIVVMTLMGEFLCMRTEMKAIPLGGGGGGSATGRDLV